MEAVRFRQSGTFTSAEGLLHYEVGALRLEYQVSDGLLGLIKSKLRQISIPLADLVSINLEESWFGDDQIILQGKTMEAVQGVPGMAQGRIELNIKRSDRDAARLLVAGLRKPDVRGLVDLDA